MILLIFALLINSLILKKYEKGNEHFYSFLFVLFLTLLYYYEPFKFYTKDIRFFLEITIPIFMFSQIFCLCMNNPNEKDYLVVLGCGLLDKNRISPLLMQRLDVASDLYQKKTNKIIVSGGKGKDEEISEASAMKTYLIEKGVCEEDILCEEKSKNTKENLSYSKEMIGNSFVVVTSDYHALRVYILSLLIGLKIGIFTSKTIYYYKFYALSREYVAIIFLFKEIILFLYFFQTLFQTLFSFHLLIKMVL